MTAAITAIVVVVLDQITKAAIVREFVRGEQVDVLGSVLRIGHAQNSGAIFGVMKGAGRFFLVFSIVAALVLGVAIYFTRRASRPTRIGLGLVLGGALGNLVDRVRLGAVVDFIDIGVNEFRWPSFNVADLAITAGVVLLLAASLKPPRTVCTLTGGDGPA